MFWHRSWQAQVGPRLLKRRRSRRVQLVSDLVGLDPQIDVRDGDYGPIADALAAHVTPPNGVGFSLIGPFKDKSTFNALCGPGDFRLTRPGRNYQDTDYIRSWLAIQGLDWIRRAVLGQLTSPADWIE